MREPPFTCGETTDQDYIGYEENVDDDDSSLLDYLAQQVGCVAPH